MVPTTTPTLLLRIIQDMTPLHRRHQGHFLIVQWVIMAVGPSPVDYGFMVVAIIRGIKEGREWGLGLDWLWVRLEEGLKYEEKIAEKVENDLDVRDDYSYCRSDY
ncbi:hypothetical protein OIU85_023727 [Salix viminalis]|uniref:Uncharacterized protein n=1 Tax=Salix viminalis TaxID=40686 RepID=A0A9Q0Z409_SALVM|nr:hypothetical protein OIU85_023727 [Salix viminalis]